MRPRTRSREEQEAEKQRRENVCGAIACSVLGGGAVWRRRDVPGGPPGLHDHDLEFDDGHVEALEVCAFTEEDAEAQRDALQGTKLRESQRLSRYWLVGIPDRGLDLRALRDGSFLSRAEAHLAVYEAHGRFEFDQADPWKLMFELGRDHPLVEAANALACMGIQHSASLPPPSGVSPSIELQVTTGGHVDPESVNRAVEDRATEPGNLAKLRAATHATARHIFVPIYFGAPMTFWAVEHVVLSCTPTLPPEVTRTWVLGGANGVLYVEPPGDWQRVPYESLATSDPDRWRASSMPEP
jgi:hypothetical protein